MQILEVQVVDMDGVSRKARQPICPCGCDLFLIFQLESQNHWHIQCSACGDSYCPSGVCEREKHGS